ncbi:MAG: biosynthetic-type acetolactate synthase large subunit [Clostridia bacterium]|nr:biosynthetic-type acetolactate synthase large subunit [Clostridia bacterium]
MTGAEVIIKCLEQENVTRVFGYPGATIAPFYDALYFGSNIKHVLVRHEAAAGHAASGYSRVSGSVGVCAVTSGPGATNLITAIATAYMDSIPLIAITGQVRSDMLGRDVFQEADITGATEPFTKYSYLVKSANDLPRIFKEAFKIASTGRPGPVLIDIPVDVQQEEFEQEFKYPEKADIPGYKPRILGHTNQISRAVGALDSAKAPLICVGGGVISAGAGKELLKLMEKHSIPAVSTLMGVGAVPYDHPLYLGMLGSHGRAAANKAVKDADLLIICGARIGDRTLAKSHQTNTTAKVIHIDVDPAEIGKNMRADIPIVGDIKSVLTSLNEKYTGKNHSEWAKLCVKPSPITLKRQPGTVEPCSFIRRLCEKCDEKAIIVADVGQNQIWTANSFSVKNGRFLTSGGMGTMGYSIPAAIGAKLAKPKRQVISICGDGAFQMQIGELASAVGSGAEIKIVILSNTRLGMIRELQDSSFGGHRCAIELGEIPDISLIAKAYGIASFDLHNDGDADDIIDKFLVQKGVCLLNCHVSPDLASVPEE